MAFDTYINPELYDEIASSSNVVSGQDYRDLVCGVSQVASDMVMKTLGPYGSTTVIDDGSGFSYPTKDGWTCLSRLQFTDPTYNTIFQMLKKISFNSNTTVGDGTTTAMVAANNFLRVMYTEFLPKLEAKNEGFRQADFIYQMNQAYTTLEKKLSENPNIQLINTDKDYQDIERIAYVATNGNDELASIIQQIYRETSNPNIQVTLDPNSNETTYAIQRGYKFNSRVLNFPAYVNDQSGSIVWKNVPRRVVIFDHNVTFQLHEKIIGAIAGISQRDNLDIIIMAPYFDDIIASWIDSQVQRMVQARQLPRIMLVQIPTTTRMHLATLSDLAILTNCQIFDEAKVKAFNILHHNQTHSEKDKITDNMFTLEEYMFDGPEDVIQRCLGKIQSIIIDKYEGFIQDYEGIMNEQKYAAVVQEVTEEYRERKRKAAKTIGGTMDKEFMFSQMRYIKLTGSTGVIRVGAVSDMQQHTEKDIIDDAVLACKSAFENGYVRGMNLEILSILHKCIEETSDMNDEDIYINDIYRMLYKCFYLTSMTVIENKHHGSLEGADPKRLIAVKKIIDGQLHVDKQYMNSQMILDMIIEGKNGAFDYDLRRESIQDVGLWEVINSTATDIEILRAVINVLTTVITSNQFLSMTRRYDAQATNEKSIQTRLKEDARYVRNKVNAAITAIAEHKNYDELQALVGGINVIPGDLESD